MNVACGSNQACCANVATCYVGGCSDLARGYNVATCNVCSGCDYAASCEIATNYIGHSSYIVGCDVSGYNQIASDITGQTQIVCCYSIGSNQITAGDVGCGCDRASGIDVSATDIADSNNIIGCGIAHYIA